MKIQWPKLLVCLAIPLGVGGLSALLSMQGMKATSQMAQPPLSPPGWVFPVAWTILYLLMGLASYLVTVAAVPKRKIRNAWIVYAVSLIFNFGWSPFYFALGLYWFSFFWLVALFASILITLLLFGRITRTAGWLLCPYLIWTAFAAYLNCSMALMHA